MVEAGTTNKTTAEIKTGSKYLTDIHKKAFLSNMVKAFSNEMEKYSGVTNEHFDMRYLLFFERCDQSDISNHDRAHALSIMMTGTARLLYLDVPHLKNFSLHDLAKSVKSCFCTW